MTVEPPLGEGGRVDPSTAPPPAQPQPPQPAPGGVYGPPGGSYGWPSTPQNMPQPPSGMSQPGWPQQGVPPQGMPQPGMPPQGMPQPGATAPGGGFTSTLPDPPPGYVNPQWGYPIAAPKPPPRPSMNGLAVASLIVGLIGGVVISAVLGIIALIQIRRRGQRGKRLAITGILLTVFWALVIAGAVVLIARSTATRGADGHVTERGSVLVTQLRVGDCVEKWSTASTVGQVGSVTVVPCTTSHDAEIFLTYAVPGTTFPGDRQVTAAATTQCLAGSKTALKPAELAKAQIAYLKPLASSWTKGDRNVICVAVSKTPVTHSIHK
ncbi:MAG TPA: septum formation family protein [Kineosporiaceae bacterium]|nr:septum formation family protein [Kineosporiaceae bacterium]